MGMLAMAYDSGWGVLPNATEAYFWANLSAAITAGYPDLPEVKPELASAVAMDMKERNRIGAKLTRSQLLAVQKRCRQWLAAFEKRKARK